jgi:DNA-directed RNA polymerase specialized sigma24 family protein
MKPQENKSEIVRAQQRDSFFKITLRGAARNHYKRVKKMRERESSFSALTNSELKMLAQFDEYFRDCYSFNILDLTVVISNYDLGEALSKLPSELLNITLLAFFLGMNDSEIGEELKMKSKAVEYRRGRSIEKLRKLMEDNDDDE